VVESPMGSSAGWEDNDRWETPSKSKQGGNPSRSSPGSPGSPDGIWRDVNGARDV
jgi:hypothetical protein